MSVATDYFRGQATVLDGKYKSSEIKGDSSNTGSNREEIFSQWLMEHLPNSVTPELGGHIIDSKKHTTGQVDVVLYNDNAPRFGGNPKSYYFAEGVIGAIQVKSKLTSSMLSSAVDNLDTVKICHLMPSAGLTMGNPSESILTGIFAFELDTKDFTSIHTVAETLKKKEEKGHKPIDFVCINRVGYVVYNRGEWTSNDEQGTKTPLPKGYIAVDGSEECIFRMVLALSSEAKKTIAIAHDFQPYFLDGWQ
jgi:hypothetical protein